MSAYESGARAGAGAEVRARAARYTVKEESERKAASTQEGRRDARVKREKAEARAYRRPPRTDQSRRRDAGDTNGDARRKLQYHKDLLYEREKRRATIVLRLRFRKFLPAWRGGRPRRK